MKSGSQKCRKPSKGSSESRPKSECNEHLTCSRPPLQTNQKHHELETQKTVFRDPYLNCVGRKYRLANMRTLLVPIGPPGSGKSTLVNGLQQFMKAISRPCSAVNLDPANDNIPYQADVDVRELVDIEEVMAREELGPNGGILWAMEEVESEFAWLEERLDDCGRCRANCFYLRIFANSANRGYHSSGSSWPTGVDDTSWGPA